MSFDLARYKERTARVYWDDLDFEAFWTSPLDAQVLRCLTYMHDVEYHTVCYLRDLLLTEAHADPKVTAFLSSWAYEEFWHGEALGAVLDAHGRSHGDARVEQTRAGLGWRDRIRPPLMMLGGLLARSDGVAVLMTWGAANEWLTQAGYSILSRKAEHPTLSELLKRIMRQEGLHIDFYASEARRRLGESKRARTITRYALSRFWRPVGTGLMPHEETAFLSTYLMTDEPGRKAMSRIDANIARLPGLEGLRVLENSVERLLDPRRTALAR